MSNLTSNAMGMDEEFMIKASRLDSIRMHSMGIFAEGLLYGVYCVLFVVCIYTSCWHRSFAKGNTNKKQSSYDALNHKILLFATVVMFLLCTSHLILAVTHHNIGIFVVSSTKPSVEKTIMDQQKYAMSGLYIMNTVIAHMVMIHRCFCVWNFQTRVIILPMLLSFVAVGLWFFGIDSPDIECLGIITLLVTSGVVTALTVGRIWWMARRLEHYQPDIPVLSNTRQRYARVMIAVIESSALYSLSLLLAAIIAEAPEKSTRLKSFSPLATSTLMQITGISPTLITVLVTLGHHTQVQHQMYLTLQSMSSPTDEGFKLTRKLTSILSRFSSLRRSKSTQSSVLDIRRHEASELVPPTSPLPSVKEEV